MTEGEYIDKKLKPFKTECCKAKVYKKGRADLRCVSCDKDVMMELVLLANMYSREFKLKGQQSAGDIESTKSSN
jgi:hypothetical protein